MIDYLKRYVIITIIYHVRLINLYVYFGKILFLEPVSTFTFHEGGVKGQCLPTALAQNIDFNLLKNS